MKKFNYPREKNNKELSKKIKRLGQIYFYEPYKREFPDISYKKIK